MRLKQIHVSCNLITKFFRQDIIHPSIKILKGLPADALLRDAEMGDFGRTVELTFQHDSFDDLPEGASIPVMACEIQNYGPLSQTLSDLTKEDRQSLYEHLHDQYDCRRYK